MSAGGWTLVFRMVGQYFTSKHGLRINSPFQLLRIRFVGQECVLERSASTAPQPPFIKANAKQEAKSENIGSLVNRYNELLADGLAQLKHATPFTDNTNIGAELAKYRNEAFTANSRPESLGKILQHHKTKSNWLVSMYARLATLRERTIDPSYCKEDYFENEQLLKRKEKAWKVLNNVVNKLAPSWGVLANLVYSSVEGRLLEVLFSTTLPVYLHQQ